MSVKKLLSLSLISIALTSSFAVYADTTTTTDTTQKALPPIVAPAAVPTITSNSDNKTATVSNPDTTLATVDNSINTKVPWTVESFLTQSDVADSLTILPPPPQFDSITFLRDEALYRKGYSLKGTDRWNQATTDADLSDSNIGKLFSQALGVDINLSQTPVTYHIISKLRTDAGDFATSSAKNHYMRIRPYAYYHQDSCTPQDDKVLSTNGSYPSGHAAIGWATALILSEIRPDRQNQILKRGYDFDESRVICGMHWQSDVDASVMVGSALVARLHVDPTFMDELNRAKAEISHIVAQQSTPATTTDTTQTSDTTN